MTAPINYEVEGSFDRNGVTYVFQAKARPKATPTNQEMADFRVAIGEPAAKSMQPGSLIREMACHMAHFASTSRPGDECTPPAREAIEIIATWLEQRSKGHLGTGTHWAAVLKDEAKR